MTTGPDPRTPLAVRLAAIPAVLAVLVAGVWLFGAVIAPGYWSAIALSVAWFLVVSVLVGRATRGRPDLRRVARGTFLLASAASLFGFWWTSIRETEVDERLVTGVPESRASRAPAQRRPRTPVNVQTHAGRVESLAHSAKGRAAVVRLATGDRRLTLRDFDIDPGPEVVVRLVAGESAGGADHVELGDLKGTRGNQQYPIPRGVDLSRYRTVVFWCVPFTQALAQAKLGRS